MEEDGDRVAGAGLERNRKAFVDRDSELLQGDDVAAAVSFQSDVFSWRITIIIIIVVVVVVVVVVIIII